MLEKKNVPSNKSQQTIKITTAAGESLYKVMVLVLPSLLKYPHGKIPEELGPKTHQIFTLEFITQMTALYK